MDKLKQKTIDDFTSWDINCPYIGSNKWKRKLKKLFRRIGRKSLKEELRKELQNG